MPYPTGTDLVVELVASGMVAMNPTPQQNLIDYAGIMAGAVAEFERRSGWFPFLSSGVDETRLYSPPGANPTGNWFYRFHGGGYLLDFDGGLLSLTSLVANGVTFTQGQQFYLQPANAPRYGQPWQTADLPFSVFGPAQAIAVTGTFGYTLTLPADVRQALLARGKSLVTAQLMHLVTGGLIEWSEAGVTERYNPQAFILQANVWDKQFQETISRYRIKTF